MINLFIVILASTLPRSCTKCSPRKSNRHKYTFVLLFLFWVTLYYIAISYFRVCLGGMKADEDVTAVLSSPQANKNSNILKNVKLKLKSNKINLFFYSFAEWKAKRQILFILQSYFFEWKFAKKRFHKLFWLPQYYMYMLWEIFSTEIINNCWTRVGKILEFVSVEQINCLPKPTAEANNWSDKSLILQ